PHPAAPDAHPQPATSSNQDAPCSAPPHSSAMRSDVSHSPSQTNSLQLARAPTPVVFMTQTFRLGERGWTETRFNLPGQATSLLATYTAGEGAGAGRTAEGRLARVPEPQDPRA